MNDYAIPFTQYLLPDGRTRHMFFDAAPDTYVQAKRIIEQGFRFEAELLTTGEVSLTVYDPKTEDDIAIELCFNGPGIDVAIDQLVKSAKDALTRRPR